MMSVDDQMKEEMISELYTRLDSFITTKIVENLPPEHLEAFMKLVDEKKPQSEVEQFLKDKIPNVQEAFSQAFAEFRELYLNSEAASRQANVYAEGKNESKAEADTASDTKDEV